MTFRLRTALLVPLFIITLGLAPIRAEATKPPLRLAMVGLEHGHARGFLTSVLQRPDVKLLGIVEPSQEVANKYATRHQLAPQLLFQSLADLLAAGKPEAVAIFTSTFDHPRVVEECARHGLHVMMEKPLAINLEHALAIARAARHGKIHVIVNFETTWYPGNQAAYRAVQEGTIGGIRKIVVHDGHRGPQGINSPPEFLGWLKDPTRGGGALLDFGCYGANLMSWLLPNQRPISVSAVLQRFQPAVYPEVEDEATIVVSYPQAQGIIQASWNWPYSRKDMEVYGQRGALFIPQRDVLRVRTERGETNSPVPPLPEGQADSVSYLAAVVRGELRPEGLSSLEVNLLVTEILDAARESGRTGKAVALPKDAPAIPR